MRKPFIAGNWKMNHNLAIAQKLVTDLQEKFKDMKDGQVEVAVCAPFVYLQALGELLRKLNKASNLPIALGAQNMHWEKSGAFTGEIAGPMLVELGCRYVIIGHSERRIILGETDAMVSKKAVAAFQHGLLPIICVGETLTQREQAQTISVVKKQLESALELLKPAQVEATTLAYEPVWAIGTGKAATPQMAQEVHHMMRQTLAERYGKSVADTVRIQYGGSVNANNFADIIAQPDIDGALVGGASLEADAFSKIVKTASQKKL